MRLRARLLPLGVLLSALPASAAPSVEVVPQRSILAIVTHRTGIASGLAHDHLIAASGYTAKLDFDPSAPTETRFEFRTPARDLVVDAPELQGSLFPRLKELEILSEPFQTISAGHRADVRKAMLGAKQLDAERFPDIAGTVLHIAAKPSAEDPFPYIVKIAFEAHGQRVEREIEARFTETKDGFELEAFGEFRFTEFRITPYSALLGAVRNQDELHLYVRLAVTAAH